MSLLKALIIVCFLANLAHARPKLTHQEAVAGSEVIIKCQFRLDEYSAASKIEVEWGMIPDRGGPYKPILRHSDFSKHQEERLNPRPLKEDCSLDINPIKQEDSGTYKAHLIVDGIYDIVIEKVKVHVIDSTPETIDSDKTFSARNIQKNKPSDSISEETSDSNPENHPINPALLNIARMIHNLKEIDGIPYFIIMLGMALILIIVEAPLAVYLCKHYIKDRSKVVAKFKMVDVTLKALKTARLQESKGNPSDVIIDLSGHLGP